MINAKLDGERYRKAVNSLYYRLDMKEIADAYYEWRLCYIVSYPKFRLNLAQAIARALIECDSVGRVFGSLKDKIALWIDWQHSYCRMYQIVNGNEMPGGKTILL